MTDDEILSIVAREADTLDATRVHEMKGGEWHATTIFDGDEAILRLARALIAAGAAAQREADAKICESRMDGRSTHHPARAEASLCAAAIRAAAPTRGEGE